VTAANVSEAIVERGITEIIHFTTVSGLIGILTSGKLLAHSELPNNIHLSHICKINCPDRSRDIDWHSYVNLSITRPNGSLFKLSRNKWHADDDIFWCILSFSPIIMTHPGVIFSTTNNAYALTKRAPDVEGLESLFAPKVRLFATKWASRTRSSISSHTTCNQAEVLYPSAVSIEHLQFVYLYSDENYHEVEAQIGVCAPHLMGKIKLIVAPDLFS